MENEHTLIIDNTLINSICNQINNVIYLHLVRNEGALEPQGIDRLAIF